MATNIFDAMIEAAARAKSQNRQLRRWEINAACRAQLLCDGRIYQNDMRDKDITERPLFGAPIALFHDRTSDPQWRLFVEEKGAAFAERTQEERENDEENTSKNGGNA